MTYNISEWLKVGKERGYLDYVMDKKLDELAKLCNNTNHKKDAEKSDYQDGTCDWCRDFVHALIAKEATIKELKAYINVQAPMGVSQWREYGKRYDYWSYFEEETKKVHVKLMDKMREEIRTGTCGMNPTGTASNCDCCFRALEAFDNARKEI